MGFESLAAQSLTAFFVTLFVIVSGAPAAHRLGLVDTPNERKHHKGQIPLVGGIAIFIALTFVTTFHDAPSRAVIAVNGIDALWVFISCGAFLVLTGILDDRLHLGVFVRILSEVLVAIAVIELLNLKVTHLGNLFATGVVSLQPSIAHMFTVISIFGVINAFNMLDGMDGLLASLVIVTLVLFHLFTATQPGSVSLTIGGSLCAFLVSNLGLSPLVPKTFLGDAGSKLLGFIVVCLLLAAASAQVGSSKLIQPVTALFIIALPLYDMVFTSLRRIVRKSSPFAADRSHIHHLLQDIGLSDRRALATIIGIHSCVALIGLTLHRATTPEYFQFAIFFACFALYSVMMSLLALSGARLQQS